MPRKGGYVGGVASLINSYLNHKMIFHNYSYDIRLYDYVSRRKRKRNKYLNFFLYFLDQRRATIQEIAKNNTDIVHIHTSREFLFLKDLLLAMYIKRKTHLPIALTIHVGDINTVFFRIEAFKKLCIMIMNKVFSKVFFLSEIIKSQFESVGFNREKGCVLYNFHDLPQVEQVLDRGHKYYFLFVGSIHREKGILELLSACSRMSDVDFSLDICGLLTDKSISDQVKSYIEQLGDKVTMHGYVTGAMKSMLYERADVFVLPSYHEGMPLVILEALRGGCAIVSTPVGTTSEILSTDNVVWTRVGSSDDLLFAMQNIIRDGDLLDQLKRNNKELSRRYSVGENIKRYCSELSLI